MINKIKAWQQLSKQQKVGLVSIFAFTALIVPLTVVLIYQQTRTNSRAYLPPTAPITNSLPYFVTKNKLPRAVVNRKYQARIIGRDKNKGDVLIMKIGNLPVGLRVNSCKRQVSKSQATINCLITGKPTQAGNYKLKAIINDNKGGVRKQTFDLKVIKISTNDPSLPPPR